MPQLTLKTKCHVKADPKTLISLAVTGRLPKINALILKLPEKKKKKKLQTWPVTMATVISFCHGCPCTVHLHHVTWSFTKWARGLEFGRHPLVHDQSVMQLLTYKTNQSSASPRLSTRSKHLPSEQVLLHITSCKYSRVEPCQAKQRGSAVITNTDCSLYLRADQNYKCALLLPAKVPGLLHPFTLSLTLHHPSPELASALFKSTLGTNFTLWSPNFL